MHTKLLLARVATLLALSLALAGCRPQLAAAPERAPTTAPAATLAPAPTAAPSTPAATPTPAPPPTATPAPTPIPGVLYVDADQRLGAISPLVYGTNYGPWMGAFLPDVQRQVDAAGFTFLRFPGGNWGDLNDLAGQQIDD